MTDNLKWEPIPLDELTRIEEIVSVFEEDGECVLTVYGEIFHSMLVLPPGVRLCRAIASPEPNWSKAPEWSKWWAVNPDGSAFWFNNKPEIVHFHCVFWHGDRHPRSAGKVNLPVGVDWRTTLRQRPEYAEP